MENADQSTPKKKIQISTIEDLPVSSDDFGGHQKVADSILQMIATEDGGKSIALEGGWGTGKSSIVAMLEANLSDKGVDTIIFDAWAHQGDPLRRVFLERLTGLCFKPLEMSQRQRWIDRKEKEITGKTKTTTSDTTSILTSNKPIKFLAAASVLPAAFLVLSFLIRLGEWNWLVFGLQFFTLLIILLPSIILLYWAVKCRGNDKEQLETVSKYVSLWKKKIDDNTVSLVSESLEPSTVEFQSFFSDLMEEYLAIEDRKILIVLDNLDRVSRSDALNLWSTLRLFADTCEKSDEAWAKKVWILVPYDLPAATKVWSSDSNALKFETSEGLFRAFGKEDASKQNDTAAAFFDKTFQIRFSVPPLHLTDWKRYLEELLNKAFGSDFLDNASLQKIYRLTEGLAQDSTPTPRLLKLFVNDLGAVARQFYHDFPIDHLALFTVLRRQGIDIREWILSGSYRSHPSKWIIGEDKYLTSLLSIYFGTTDRNRAQVLLFRNPLETALTKGNGDALAKLLLIHGFWDASESFIRNELFNSTVSHAVFCQTAIALSKSEMVSKAPTHYRDAIVELSKRILRMVKLERLDKSTGESAALFLNVANDKQSTKDFINKSTQIPKSEDSTFSVENWLAGWLPMQAVATEHEHPFTTILPDSENEVIAIIASISDEDIPESSVETLKLPAGVSHGDLVQALIGSSESIWGDKRSKACLQINKTGLFGLSLSAVIESFDDRLEEPSTEAEEANTIIYTLLALLENYPSEVKEVFRSFIEDGSSLLQQVKNRHANSYDFSELIVVSYVSGVEITIPSDAAQRKPYTPLIDAVSDEDSIEKNASKVAEALKNFTAAPWIVSLFINDSLGDKIGAKVLSLTAESSNFAALFREVDFTEAMTEFNSHIDISLLRRTCKRVIETDSYYGAIKEITISEESIWLNKILIEEGASQNADYSATVEGFLSERGFDEWIVSISQRDEILELALSYIKVIREYHLPANFCQGLEDYCRDIIKQSEDVSWEYEPEGWKLILSRIPDHRRGTINSRVIDDIFASNPNNLSSLINLLGDELAIRYARSKHESLVRRVAEPILKLNRAVAVEWLQLASSKSNDFWTSANVDDQNTFRETLIRRVRQNEPDEQISSSLKLVARNLGIDLNVVDDEEQEPERQ